MGSQVRKVLLQGVWGSLSGGWYFNPRFSKFTNVFHLYTWLILMMLPFIFFIAPIGITSWGAICSYAATVFGIFASIKAINYRLHSTFDKGDIVKREVVQNGEENNQHEINTDPNPEFSQIDERIRADLAAADIFPIANISEHLENQGDAAAGDGDSKAKKEENGVGNSTKPISVGDLQVDVHAAPVDLFQAESNNNTEKANRVMIKAKRRRPRHRVRSETEPSLRPGRHDKPRKKSVAFAEATASTGKTRNVSRCMSLPSATSDSEDETDSYSNSSSDPDDTSDSTANGTSATNGLRIKRAKKPHRRLAIRGAHRHPWVGDARTGERMTEEQLKRANRGSSGSSGAGDELSKVDGNSNKMTKHHENPEHSSGAPAASGGESRSSSAKDKTTVEAQENIRLATDSKTDKGNISETEKEFPTSDQELLSKDPVLMARRSLRYSSNRRPFFRRRSYTVNSLRQVTPEWRTRRGLSTVPPYREQRTFSSPRPTPSSLKKLLSLWTREHNSQMNEVVPSSPGEVSPGEVRLTSHSIHNSEIHSANTLPTNESNVPKDFTLQDVLDKNEQKSDSTSRNSNPHFSETHTPERKAEENKKKVLSIGETHRKSQRPKKPTRSKSSVTSITTGPTLKEPCKDEPRIDVFSSKRPDTPIPGDHPHDQSDEDSETDMNEFVNKLIGDRAAWQGNENTVDGGNCESENASAMKLPKQTSNVQMQSSGNENLEGAPNLDENLEPHLKEPEPVFQMPPSSPDTADSTPRPRSSVMSSQHSQSSRGRRTRHPAGESQSRLTSNTSEESTTAPSSQRLSSVHFTDYATVKNHNASDDVATIDVNTEDAPGAHFAVEHDDTSAGATHTFQDEHGNWLTYTFGEASGTAQMLSSNSGRTRLKRQRTHSLVQDGSSDEPKSPQESTQDQTSHRFSIPSIRRRNRNFSLPQLEFDDTSDNMNHGDWPDMSPIDMMMDGPSLLRRRPTTPKVKLFYKFQLLPFKTIILQYDRLSLLDLLDRNRHLIENVSSVFLAMIVAVLGLLLLQKEFFFDIWPLWFCVVIATAQYTLISSVQPDSASPTHGHNRVIAYSRPIYFCALALLILLFDYLGNGPAYVPNSYIYADLYFTKASCLIARDVLLAFIMVLPFVFLLGLLPQITTFVMYFAEQTEIHMFGGSACTSLPSAVFSLARSIVFSLCLFGFCYGGMNTLNQSQHLLFSVFCGLLVSVSYHLSRQTNDPLHLWRIIRAKVFCGGTEETAADVDAEIGAVDNQQLNPDEISSRYVHKTLSERLQYDLIVCPLLAIFAFAIHCSTAFTVLQPLLSIVLYSVAALVGFTLHYLLPQLRKNLPWLLFSSPILKAREYAIFEVLDEAHVMWFERWLVRFEFIERNFIYPLIIMNQLTIDAENVVDLYSLGWGCVLLTIVGLKLLRSSYGMTAMQYSSLAFSALYIKYDTRNSRDSILITYFLVTILFVKFQDLMLKLQFVYVYIAPWQITWGSTFHAFAQPISVPHSGMLLINTVMSSLLHAPLAPFMGSAIFLTSYMRPLKFWEKNYNTKRVDNSNTRLAAQIDRGPSSDDNNLNSIFYEHLTLSLQKSLCGDIAMGRWGTVYPGDCFVMTSDYLNALIHIIQKGNGVISFQVRGLEFSGTYCQQREVEAISETIDNKKCCCCKLGHPKNMISFNMAFQRRWLAWQIQTTNFVLDGYSISDISATSMLGVYDLRKVLLSYMVKSVIYFLVAHDSLDKWLHNEGIETVISSCEVPEYVDVDTSFSVTVHEDYDMWLSGISRTKFEAVYGKWIRVCASQREQPIAAEDEAKLVTLCFMVSVLCRRALGTASVNLTSSHIAMESFMYGLHSLFKGDFRITSSKDEWIFNDMDLMHNVVVPGVRMAIKLHQDHFQDMDDTQENWEVRLYRRIRKHTNCMIITHEGDPEWRRAVLSNRDSLLALRHVAGDAVDSYFVLTLRKRSQGFLVVRINRECVKGLWAGQQQELVFLRNSNPERGSIQNAKQVLRNMINSSCDQPIGYPIYVSPVTTSFSNTHPSYQKIAGRSMSLQGIRNAMSNIWNCLLQSCGGGCNSGGSAGIHIGNDHIRQQPPVISPAQVYAPPASGTRPAVAGSVSSGSQIGGLDHSDQLSISRLSKNSSRRSISIGESRVVAPPIMEELSSQPLSSRSSARWRAVVDNARTRSRHSSATGSNEANVRKAYRNSRKEGSETFVSIDLREKLSRPSASSEEAAVVNTQSGINGEGKDSNSSASEDILDRFTWKSSDEVEVAKSSSRPSSRSRKNSRQRKRNVKHSRKVQKEEIKEYVKIVDPARVLGTLEIHRPVDHVKWPNEEWRKFGGKSKWGGWTPSKDDVGEVVFRWYPNHRDANLRSHIGELILLLRIKNPSGKGSFYVPIPEKCTIPHQLEIVTTQL